METIKEIQDASGTIKISQPNIDCVISQDEHVILIEPKNVLALAHAIIENCGWIDAQNNPPNETCWCRVRGINLFGSPTPVARYEKCSDGGIWQVCFGGAQMDIKPPTHYQIIQP